MWQSKEEEEGESLGELKERVKASTRGEESVGEDEEGPKMRRSLREEGVIGTEISSFSGRESSDGGFILKLKYGGNRGSFSISVCKIKNCFFGTKTGFETGTKTGVWKRKLKLCVLGSEHQDFCEYYDF